MTATAALAARQTRRLRDDRAALLAPGVPRPRAAWRRRANAAATVALFAVFALLVVLPVAV